VKEILNCTPREMGAVVKLREAIVDVPKLLLESA
jgi:hypothetical protein